MLVVERKSVDAQGRESFTLGIEATVKLLFGRNIVACLNARGWPGTKLLGGTGRVFVVRFNEAVKDLMVSTEGELFEWQHASPKRLPEDICILRAGSKFPVFASTTHEKDAYVVTEGRDVPAGFRETKYSISKLMLAWDGPYLCLL